MTWSRFDDGYDEHEKIENAWFDDDATVGLHAMATTACNRWLSDGVIRPRWLQHKLPGARKRGAVLAAMVRHGLFDVLAAGQSHVLIDADGNQIPVGPFDEDRYVVHDFLDRHDSSVQVKERRRKDSERKKPNRSTDSNGTPRGIQAESSGNPRGSRTDSSASRAGARASAPAHPDPTRPDPSPPSPPKGGRKRDRDTFIEACQSYGLEHFPDLPGDHGKAVEQAVTSGKATTLEEVTAFVDQWWPRSPAALGARVVAFNASAESDAA